MSNKKIGNSLIFYQMVVTPPHPPISEVWYISCFYKGVWLGYSRLWFGNKNYYFLIFYLTASLTCTYLCVVVFAQQGTEKLYINYKITKFMITFYKIYKNEW